MNKRGSNAILWCAKYSFIRNIKIEAHGPNNDGIDPDGCKDVLIENCTLDVGDDNIALKSGRDEEAWEIGTTCENILVRNCQALRGHGGFVIGSEMSAGVRNVLVEYCSFRNTDRGIRIKTRLGRGGVVHNISIRNISMQNIKNEAIVINMRYNAEPIERNIEFGENEKAIPHIKNVNIANVTCSNAKHAVRLTGLAPNTLSNIKLVNLDITAENGINIDNSSKIGIFNFKLHTTAEKQIVITDSEKIEISSDDFFKTCNNCYSVANSRDILIDGNTF